MRCDLHVHGGKLHGRAGDFSSDALRETRVSLDDAGFTVTCAVLALLLQRTLVRSAC